MDLFDKDIFLDKINKINRLYLVPYYSRLKHDEEYNKFTEKTISVLFDYAKFNNDGIDSVVEIYNNYCLEYLDLQSDFNKTGIYKFSSYSELNSILDSAFNKNYIYVLLISFLTTTYRYDMMNYISTLMHQYLNEKEENGLEIGFGSGIDLLSREKYFKSYDIFEINNFSQTIFNLLFEKNKTFAFNKSLYSFDDNNKYSFVQLIELMEHLENPQYYIDSSYKILSNNGYLIFTAAVNMANIDHIFLFDSILSVRNLIDSTKWEIMEEKCFINSIISYPKSKFDDIINNNKAPYIVVYLLKKK